jgi:hypothetical protein
MMGRQGLLASPGYLSVVRRPGQHLLDLNRNPVAIDHHHA